MRESLLVQISNHPDPHPRAAEVVEGHLEALEKQKLREIEKALKISDTALKEVVAFLRTLDPLPGSSFSREVARYVVPDVQVTLRDGEFIILLNDEMIPVLGVNPLFETIAREKSADTSSPRVRPRERAGRPLVHPHHRPEESHAAEGRAGPSWSSSATSSCGGPSTCGPSP